VDAPVSKRRLFGSGKRPSSGEHNLKAIRRYVLQCWLETERKPMLVICQKRTEEWFKKAGLPDGIMVEHYNNISGLDRYKDVRRLILIGRTIPSPVTVEAYAGALTGAEPLKMVNWYEPVTRGIRLADGNGIGVERRAPGPGGRSRSLADLRSRANAGTRPCARRQPDGGNAAPGRYFGRCRAAGRRKRGHTLAGAELGGRDAGRRDRTDQPGGYG